MATLMELITQQAAAEKKLSDAYKNFKKLSVNKRTISACVKALGDLNTLWSQMRKTHEDIKSKAEEDDNTQLAYFKDNFFANVQDKHDIYLSLIQEFMSAANDNIVPPEDPSDEEENIVEHKHRGLKLEPLKIQKFSGSKSAYWNPFSLLIQSVIKSNRLSKIEQFQFLRQHLEGTALSLIAHISPSDNAYAVSLSILKETYENKRKIVNDEILKLIDQPVVTQNSAKAMLHLRTVIREVLANLEGQEVDTSSWDPMLVPIICRKLDVETKKDLENSLSDPKALLTLEQVTTVMDRRLIKLDNIPDGNVVVNGKNNGNSNFHKNDLNGKNSSNSNFNKNAAKNMDAHCLLCEGSHFTLQCEKFVTASTDVKVQMLLSKHICLQCGSHPYSSGVECQKKLFIKCKICQRRHKTSLHYCQYKKLNTNADASQKPSAQKTTNGAITNECVQDLLPTAIVHVEQNNKSDIARIMLDRGSAKSYISKQYANMLGLKIIKTNEKIKMLGLKSTPLGVAEYQTTITLRSLKDFNKFVEVTAYLIDGDPVQLPSVDLPEEIFKKLRNLPLADENLHRPCGVKLLIGGKYYNKIMSNTTLPIDFDDLRAHDTLFGWVVGGEIKESKKRFYSSNVIAAEAEEIENGLLIKNFHNALVTTTSQTDENLTKQIESFWELPSTTLDLEEKRKGILSDAVRQYDDKYFIDKEGRLNVPYIFESEPEKLGKSYGAAFHIFLAQERKLLENEEKYEKVQEFMKAYRDKGHMVLSKNPFKVNDGTKYYVPHHTVLKTDSLTTKVREVFNFSYKTSTGVDFNSTVSPGPNLLPKISKILFAFRQYAYVFTSDVEMMYRQLNLIPEHQDIARVLWRENPKQKVLEWSLKTVTYGCACAPFQAVYSLHKIAELAKNAEVAFHLRNSFYVDDLCAGDHEISKAQKLATDINNEMKQYKMPLAKWGTNDKEVLQNIPPEKLIENYQSSNEPIKLLGILWDPIADEMSIKINNDQLDDNNFTMRNVLGKNSEVWDPLNFLLPVIMLLRMTMQKVHALKIDWDDEISPELRACFKKIYEALNILNEIKIPRWLKCGLETINELVCFSDASAKGYACVIYARIFKNNKYHVTFMGARGRVAPMKSAASIPRLELEGVVLTYELLQEMLSAFRGINISKIRVYCDSAVACCWIKHVKQSTKKIIKKRVTAIASLINGENIFWIPSGQNVSDIASRGATPEQLMEYKDWIEGPKWLSDYKLPEFQPENECDHDLPISNTLNIHTETVSHELITLAEKFSNWEKLLRIVAFVFKFILLRTLIGGNLKAFKEKLKISMLPATLYHKAMMAIIKAQQYVSFTHDYATIKQNGSVIRSSPLFFLRPFIDSEGVLRVGGRLANALVLTYDERHPIILPRISHITELIIRNAHEITLHAPLGVLMRQLRSNFFIINLRKQCKKIINNCVVCKRHAGRTRQPPMGDLPEDRIKPSYQWEATGVDLCGPFEVKSSRLRKAPLIKVWVVIFIDFFSRAIHLECCTDLTRDAFLDAIRRFVSRRAKPSRFYSDNGTNIKSAFKLIKKLYHLSVDKLNEEQIEWKFNPVAGSHFGGIFERGVRSFKQILFKVCSPVALRYEEFLSLVIRIEALLNSRPIFPLNENSEQELYISPFHFMAHRALIPLPVMDYSSSSVPLSKRWAMVDAYVQKIWALWKNECLLTMHKAQKWLANAPNLKENDVVLIRDENTKPGIWPMGRVVKVYPDKKGVVRVVDVKENNKIKKRPVNKLVPLVSEDKAITTRTSPRKSKNNIATTTATLFTLAIGLSLLPSSGAFKVIELKSDILIAKEFSVGIQRENWKIECDTKLNYTEDAIKLDNLLNDLTKKCEKTLRFDCDSVIKIMQRDANEISPALKRFKRHPAVIITLVISGLSVLGLTIWTGVQQQQISDLKDHVEQLSENLEKLLKTTKAMQEQELIFRDHLMDAKQHIAALESSNDVLLSITAIKDFMDELKEKYNSYMKLPPELDEIIRKKREELENDMIKLPIGSNDEIAIIIPPELNHENDIIKVTYTIPLLDARSYYQYRLISFADTNNTMVDIEKEIVIDRTNTTYFIPRLNKKLQAKNELIYAEPIERSVHGNKCLQNILMKNEVIDTCPKEILASKNVAMWEKLNDHSIIFDNVEKFNIKCKQNEESYDIRRGLIVLDENCQVTSKDMIYKAPLTTKQNLYTKSWNFQPIIPRETKKIDTFVPFTFIDFFDKEQQKVDRSVQVSILVVFAVTCIILVATIIIIVIKVLKKIQKNKQNPQPETPNNNFTPTAPQINVDPNVAKRAAQLAKPSQN